MRVCIYCGSRNGNQQHQQAAIDMGKEIAKRGHSLVYGGGTTGLMGLVANSTSLAGGQVHGIITEALLSSEVKGATIGRTTIVKTMHERKALMIAEADMIIAMPGGFGTLDELCEAISWAQLKIHNKPIGLLNVDGYFNSLIDMFNFGTSCKLIEPEHLSIVHIKNDLNVLLDILTPFVPPRP